MLENQIEDFDNKVNALETKIENNGGKIREQETTAVQSVYIDASQRGEIIRTAGARTAVQQTDGESLHNARIRAMERTEAFLEWRERINKPSQPSKSLKEYVSLRAKQLGLGIEGKTLSDEERARLKELESEFVVPLNKYFAVDESLYEAAKQEVEAIADEVASIVRDAFTSKFPIKKPSRAAIKTVRWYSGQANLLGDGSRTNIIVSNDADADTIFEELERRYSIEGITRTERETTELGYPKRLIEVLTPSGKIAEIQVMTPKGY